MWHLKRGVRGPRAGAQAIILAHPNVPGVMVTSSLSCRTWPSLYQVISAAGWDWMSHTSETLPFDNAIDVFGVCTHTPGSFCSSAPKREWQRGGITVEVDASPGGSTHPSLSPARRVWHLDLLVQGEPDQHEGTEAAMQFQSHRRLQLVEKEEEGSKSVTQGRCLALHGEGKVLLS